MGIVQLFKGFFGKRGLVLNNVIAVVLAGGFGTRIKDLLPHLPKPLAPVAGQPFLGWVLTYLQRQGLTQMLISTGYQAEAIAAYAQTQPLPDLQLACYPETEPLGTAGGFINAVQRSTETPQIWLVLNGDSLVMTDLAPLLAYLEDDTVEGVILGVTVEDASRYGSLVFDETGTLLKFAEKQAGQGVINGGVYLFRHRLLQNWLLQPWTQQIPLSFEYDIFPQLLAQKVSLKVHPVTAPFLDIGTPASLAQAESFIQTTFADAFS